MESEKDNSVCRIVCWIVAALLGLLVAIWLMRSMDWSVISAIIAGLVGFAALGYLMSRTFCGAARQIGHSSMSTGAMTGAAAAGVGAVGAAGAAVASKAMDAGAGAVDAASDAGAEARAAASRQMEAAQKAKSCRTTCWIVAGILGLLVAYWCFRPMAMSGLVSLLAGLVAFAVLGYLLSRMFCQSAHADLGSARGVAAAAGGAGVAAAAASVAQASGPSAEEIAAKKRAEEERQREEAREKARSRRQAAEAEAAEERARADAAATEARRKAEADAAAEAEAATARADAAARDASDQAEAERKAAEAAAAQARAEEAETARRREAEATRAREAEEAARARAEEARRQEAEAERQREADAAAAQARAEDARRQEAEAARQRDADAAATRARAEEARQAEADSARAASQDRPMAEGMAEAAPAAAGFAATGRGRQPRGLAGPRGGRADDLKEIRGVGPKMETMLHGMGYYHFDQVAAWDDAEVDWVDDNLEGFNGRVTRDRWVPQARLLARGERVSEAEFGAIQADEGAAARRPEGLSGPRGGKADDLKLIKGVGPEMERMLHGMGYYHFDQIADWGDEEVAWVDHNLEGFKGRVTRDDWVPQARILARGGRDFDGDGTLEGTNEGTRPAGLSGPRGGTADDLKRIKGVGPKMEKLLFSLGFYHFDQIAAWTLDEVAWVDANLEGFKGRVTRDTWVDQARLLATGAETEFSRRVDKGDVY